MTPRPILAALAAASLLAACAGTAGDRVVGSELDEGGFGLATARNHQAMTAEGSVVAHLGARFAAEVPATITFPFDSATLDATARSALDAQATFMLRFPEVRFSVYGHADEPGSTPYNEALGLRRARAAVAYLVSRGVSASRLAALASFGETRPVVPTAGRERANRRTVTTVTGFDTTSGMVLDGKYARYAYDRYVRRYTVRASDATASAAPGAAASSAAASADQ